MKRYVSVLLLAGLAFGFQGPQAQAANPSSKYVANEVIVQYRDGTTEAQHAAARSQVQAERKEHLRTQQGGASKLEVILLRGGNVGSAIEALKKNPNVEFAEPNYIYTHGAASTDTYYTNGSLWGMYGAGTTPANQYGSNAAAAWAAGNTGSKAVYVGVIDEGIQYNHPDLDAQVWNNPFDVADGRDNDGNGYIDDTRGWDFANGDNTIYDGGTRGSTDDHGTHVSGTIGAESNGTGVVGVNWNVTLISGKFLGRSGGTTANAVKAVDYFNDLKTRHGLNIVATNNSWGGGGYSQALYDAIARANNAGILFIAAAGNSGTNNDTTASYPSNYDLPNVIAVAAIDKAGLLTSWSQYGAKTVDLGAPGAAIYSTTAYNLYESYSGTSMATPHVTGAAALYASVKPGATAATIKNALLSSAVPTASLQGKTVTGGRLDAFAALSK
jgi:subtilisin family serine protease